jgi:malate dehydrogenase (oxaloacetate-decarboxylating)(NADP+)
VLSHSNFGSTRSDEAERVQKAVAEAKSAFPDLVLDGEVQANIALDNRLLAENYPFSDLVGERVNTLIFPNLTAGNAAYKLIGQLGGAELIGPILMGMHKPVQILQLGSSVREIVNVVALTVVEAQRRGQG